MKKKIFLVLTIVLSFLIINDVGADLTDYTGGSSGSVSGMGSGSWYPDSLGLKISIVDSTGKAKDSEIILNRAEASTMKFSASTKPKTVQSATISWTTGVTYYVSSGLLNFKWKDDNNNTVDLHQKLSSDSFKLLKDLLALKTTDGVSVFTGLSAGDYILVEPMVRIDPYYGTAFEMLNSLDDTTYKDYNSSWGTFTNWYSGAVFGGGVVSNKPDYLNGGVLYKSLYLSSPVTALGLTTYGSTDDTTAEASANKFSYRNRCLRSSTCGRGIGVYKYDDIFDIPVVEKYTLDLNYCVDGKIEYNLPRYPTNFSYDFTLNGSNSSLTYYIDSLAKGTRYNISNIAVIGNDYEYKGYNLNTYGNCAVNNTSNNISGIVNQDFTSVNLVFETTCDKKLTDLKQANGTWNPKDLFDLYKMYKDKGKDYRNLLNVSNPSCTAKDATEKEVKNLSCLSASIEKDNFNEKNLSDYDEIVTDISGNYIGFCSTTMNLENNLQTNKFYSKAGQFLVKQNSKSIQYDSTGGSKTNVCGSSISSANVQKSCYVLTGSAPSLNDFYKTDNSISVYFGDNDLNSQADKLPFSVKENSVTPANTTNSSLKLYNYEKKYNFGLNTVYLDKISGRASTSYIQGSTPIKGIISLFNSSSGTIPFKLIYDGKEYDSTSCKYQTLPEITINNKLNLEFRSIDTNTPFGRTPNSNWNDGSGSNLDDNQLVQEHIINATNSYGMLNGEKQTPLYRIELGPNDIKAIREYNKVNAYDNYSVECKTDMDGVTTCENTFLKGLENGYIKTKNEDGKQLNVSNRLIANSTSTISYYNPVDSELESDLFADEEVCKFKSIYRPVTEETKTTGNIPYGEFRAGDEYIIEVKPGTEYHFFVLSTDDDNVNLIMNRNICEDGTYATSTNTCLMSWITYSLYNENNPEGARVDTDKGPITAMNYLYNATKSWVNVNPMNVVHNESQNNSRVYKSFISVNGIAKITSAAGDVTSFGTQEFPLRARLPIRSELSYGKEFLFDYLSESHPNLIEGIHGYWTLSSTDWGDSLKVMAKYLNTAYGNSRGDMFGVRPVITIPKSYLIN